MKRSWLVVVAAVAVLAIVVVAWQTTSRSPAPPVAASHAPSGSATGSSTGPGDAGRPNRLSATERERLRERILAGNAQIARPDGALPDATVAPTGGPDDDDDDDTQPDKPTPYTQEVFDVASKIVDDCMQKHGDSGTKVAVKYIVIADDDAGGLFEDVQLPPETNNSGPETLECVMEEMLGAVLPVPPDDIGRFSFGVEIEIVLFDARPP